MRHVLAAQQALDDAEGLDHPGDPDAWWVVGDPELSVVVALPAGAQSEVQATAAQPIERGRLARDDQWMAEVVGEHVRPDPQRAGDSRGGRQRRGRGELPMEVVGDVQRRETEVLHSSRECGPAICLIGIVHVDGESEGLHGLTVARPPTVITTPGR